MHRDVKPENMLLNARQEVLLSDFGLAMLTPHTFSCRTQAMDQAVFLTFQVLLDPVPAFQTPKRAI